MEKGNLSPLWFSNEAQPLICRTIAINGIEKENEKTIFCTELSNIQDVKAAKTANPIFRSAALSCSYEPCW